MSAITIMDYLAQHAEQTPDRVALICVDRKQRTSWTYHALYQRCIWLANHIHTQAKAGDRALILMDSGIDYVSSFFACQYIGVTAIPSFPPESTKEQHIARTVGIAEDSQAAVVLTTTRFAETVHAMVEQTSNSTMLVVDTLDESIAQVQRYDACENDISFLQYTSGSTAKPKGVMVSHRNLIANERAIAEVIETSAEDVFVSWLPLFHDMGLIGGLLQPVFSGFPLVLASPRYFMEKPVRWLELISEYKGTISGGPDFAFRLCLERIKDKQRAALDLSSWRVAFSGAEPIRHDTLYDFADSFSVNGFKEEALYPCYGLAEGTLLVTGSKAGAGAQIEAFCNNALSAGKARQVVPQDNRNSHEYSHQVSCGYTPSKHTLRITNVNTLAKVDDGTIGEIWAAGPSIAVGYWQNAQATADTFVELDGKRWLRTGDVGYIFEGQLYISGRQKDLIIMNGHNIYPQDIERAIEDSLQFVRKGRVSAFPVKSHESGEGIGLAIETSNSYRNDTAEQVTAQIVRDFIISEFKVAPKLLLLLDQGGLPKTSSGKLQRSACLKLHLQDSLPSYGVFDQHQLQMLENGAPSDITLWNEDEQRLVDIWQQVLRYPVRSKDADFFALGGNSIKATQLLAQVQQQFNCYIEPASVFEATRFGAFYDLVTHARQQTLHDITVLNVTEAPLSAQQLRQWFLWQLQPKSNAYHIGGMFDLAGQIDVSLFQASCEMLLLQHPILTHRYYKTSASQVVQTPQKQSLNWRYVDLSASAQSALQWTTEFNQQPFNLSQGENCRIALIKTSEHTFHWVIILHHIAGDAWSFDLMLESVVQNYIRLSEGERESAITSNAIAYGDYASWQQGWLASGEAQAQLEYWQAQLMQTGDEVLLVPDKPRSGNQASPMQTTTLSLGHVQVEQLQKRAHQQGASLFMLLLSALQVLFYRRTGLAAPRIGVPIANRNQNALQRLVGYFINTQVYTARLHSQMSFNDVLQQCKSTSIAAQKNQLLPFERLVEVINPVRNLGETPLFQVMFNHVEHDFSILSSLPDAELVQVQPLQSLAQFDVSLDSRLMANGQLHIEFQYAENLYHHETIESLKESFAVLLEQLSQSSVPSISEVTLLSKEKHAALLTLGKGEKQVAPDRHWLVTVTDIAQREPERTALVFQDAHYSYSWLERHSNALADILLSNNVKAESVVGVMLARTPNMLASILAILKVGAAYLPLDRAFPAEKLQHMLDDSGCVVIFSEHQECTLQFAGTWLAPTALLVNGDLNMTAPNIAVHPQQTAYLNYTSGSTGKAKGVAIPHGPLAQYIESAVEFIRLRESDVVLQFATANFDAFVEQVFPTWCVGGAIVLRDDSLWDAKKLLTQAQKHHISVMDLSAAYWRTVAKSWAQMATSQGSLILPQLRQVHSGGEAMSLAAIQDWHAAGLSHVKLLNTYGPTEALVEVAIYDCAQLRHNTREQEAVPLGRPLAGRQLYVLDEQLDLVCDGQVGELYVGGAQLARGYWQRAAQTAQVFVADPYADELGARMYATGDLVSWRDGQLHYHGRRDHQVKVRGFRVELSEIEHVLATLPDVEFAVVVPRESEHGTRLCAYVANAQGNVTSKQIKHVLKNQLPSYMVPEHIEVVAELPINSSGKVDRQNLPVLTDLSTGHTITPASNAMEQYIHEIWAKQLRQTQIDRNANFFDIGGHSLLLLAVHGDLQVDHPNLEVTELFTYPTIAGLAEALQSTNTQIKSQQQPNREKQRRGMGAIAARRRKVTGS
ncbi:amino acid adenylation domain-containing protein [Pseudoalteromonas sp. MMG013]|uniref:non-ribosomal peptide synthetase n=1 Tax=Pseudoalteromonas sp. MMG013 TaxID=2822687 RepID=UPI001B36231E|nr:non-ribosomal peptide synthetase [Pseudoalteromonas sp. MMG013]MBQ4862080.1 amino acid adenylation domain-containing protein [Pseudoalteromonas sp. MMG013]